MSVFEMFKRKNNDERIVAQMNEIYRIGYMITTVGYMIILFYGLCCIQVAFVKYGEVVITDYIDPAMLLVVMVANFTCLIISTRRGITDSSRYANTEAFPTRYYVTLWSLVGLVCGIALVVLRVFAEWRIAGFDNIMWAADLTIGFGFAVTVLTFGIIAQVLLFRTAKKRLDRQIGKLEDK